MKPADKVTSSVLLLAILGAGWWAASGRGVATMEQAGAAVAAGLAAWRWRSQPARSLTGADAGALALATGGLALGWAWPAAVALAWTLARGEPAGLPRWRLAALGLLAAPWIAADAVAIGWGFRYTGAWAAGWVFDLAGLAVTRSGTSLQVEDQPLAVDAACAGLDTLQSTLVAGLWLAETLRTPGAWWRAVAMLPLLAWLANTARIVMLGAVALTAGHEAAKGAFHEWGGLGVVVLVFVCAGVWVNWLKSREARASRAGAEVKS